jgi:hypothetical protein
MVAEQVPEKLIAGDSWAWERELPDYPAPAWTLTYHFSNAAANFDITATASGTAHAAARTPAESGELTSGRYRWHARVTNGTDSFTVEDGWLEVLPDPSSGAADWRSHARKMLDAIEATLEDSATKTQLDLVSYSIGGEVSLTRDRELLLKLRAQYTLELADEDGVDRISNRHIYVRFGKP